MNYLISPWWFYWFDVASEIEAAITVMGIFAALLAAGLYINYANSEYDKMPSSTKKIIRILLIVSVLFIVISVFISSQEAMLTMQVARLSTPENMEIAVESAKSVIDYIADTIKSIR